MPEWVILKFGGSSVADKKHWRTIADQVSKHLEIGDKPLLVLSALKNVSNLLEALLHQALAGVHPNAIAHLEEHHLGFAAQLGINLAHDIRPIIDSLNQRCDEIFSAGEISPQHHAEILACGELLSTLIGVNYLQNKGIEANRIDARKILRSSNDLDPWHHFTSAECLYENDEHWGNLSYRELIEKCDNTSSLDNTSSQENGVIVTQGFIASDQEGKTVLLGREGSDTSAAYLGALLKAKQIEIWTDVTGVFSSNPREIKQTMQIPSLSYSQANLMANLGAKVLHPRAVDPARKNQIPLCVRSTGEPEHQGTTISDQDSTLNPVGMVYEPKLLSIQSKQSILRDDSLLKKNLQSIGYDLIRAFSDGEQSMTISYWHYANSDVPEQDTEELLHLINSDNTHLVELLPQVALISLIGKSLDMPEFLQGLNQEKILRVHDQDEGFYSICVHSHDCLEVAQSIHDRAFS